MPTATPTPSPTALLNFPFLNSLSPTLAILLQIIALLAAVYGFIRGIVDVVGWLRRPRLKVYMSDDLWPVGEANQSQLAINLQFVAHNPGKRVAVLRRLEASLIRPQFSDAYPEKIFALVSRRYIKGNPSGFEHTETFFAQPVPPSESIVMGVQLRGQYAPGDSTRPVCFDWFPGRYTLHLHGLINNHRKRLSPRCGFTFELNDMKACQLSPMDKVFEPRAKSVKLMN
jgi:hypothetical protein